MAKDMFRIGVIRKPSGLSWADDSLANHLREVRIYNLLVRDLGLRETQAKQDDMWSSLDTLWSKSAEIQSD